MLGTELDDRANIRHQMLFMLTAAYVLNHLDRNILNIVLNDIGIEFNLSDLQLGTLSGLAFAVIYALLGFPIAKLAKPGRRKIILVTATAVWSGMTMLMGVTTNYIQLFLTRVGVGIGEAGCVPPSHVMIVDAYPEDKRATALAIFSAGTNIGIFLSFLFGGYIAVQFGWRMAFLAAGLPGLILAIVMLVTLREPKVGRSYGASANSASASYRDVLFTLFKDPSTRHVIFGAALVAVVGYGAVTWVATFLARTHGLPLGQIGLYLAITIGVFGALGTWFGGLIADRLGNKYPDWRLKFISITILIAKPLSIVFYLSDNLTFALILFIVPATVGTMFTGPTFAHIYSSIAPATRPMATAIMMFTINVVGLGLGPVFVGFVSDMLAASQGADSLRYALVIIQLAGLWAAVHFWLAGRIVKKSRSESFAPRQAAK